METKRGFLHTGKPDVTPGDFKENLPDDTYVVSGIDHFISTDDNDNPVFSTSYGGDLKVAFEFRVVGQERGLACSQTVANFYALALAFGANLKDVNFKNRMSSDILKDVQKSINAAGKTLTVQSKNGWVNYIRAADLPEGQYAFRLKEIRRRDFQPGLEFVAGEYGANLIFEFEVTGDGAGRNSLWNGYTLPMFMNDPWVDSFEDDDTLVTSHEAGCPIFQKDHNSGGDTLLVRRWVEFISWYAPEVLEHAWQADAVKSKFGIDEIASPQYVVAGYALAQPRSFVMLYKMRKNKRGLDLLELPLFNASEVSEEDNETEQPVALLTLVDFIERAWGKDIFDNTPGNSSIVVFTDKGKTWAKEVMQPVWSDVGLGDKKPLHKLSEEETNKLLIGLREAHGQSIPEDEPETW